LDKLLALTESTIQTHFGSILRDTNDEQQSFLIKDIPPQNSTTSELILIYLKNLREIIGLITNVIINQIKIIVNKRVIYSREEFSFEAYLSLGMSD
jgi:hypothetical protein